MLFSFHHHTTLAQLVQNRPLPPIFLEMNQEERMVLDIGDFFDGSASTPVALRAVKTAPGYTFRLADDTKIYLTPTKNFIGETKLRLTVRSGTSILTTHLEILVKMPEAFNQACGTKIVNIGIYNFDPKMPQYGGVSCHQAYRWNDPIDLTEQYFEAINDISHNRVLLNLKYWTTINDWPIKQDWYQYTAASYDDCISRGNCHDPDIINYPATIRDYDIDDMIRQRRFEEVWFFGGPNFGYWEASMAGQSAYFVNGGVYPSIATEQPFVIMGFNYERGLAEMIHSNGHRTENHLKRVHTNQWNLGNPSSNWDFFTTYAARSRAVSGVGNIHFPPNGMSDYDYANPNFVESRALDYLNYPNLSGATTLVNRETWGGPDYSLNYMKWWHSLLPHFDGINSDNRLNNWWDYIYNYSYFNLAGQSLNTPVEIATDSLHFSFEELPFGWTYLFNISDYFTDSETSFPTLSLSKPFKIEGDEVFFYFDGYAGRYTGFVKGCDENILIELPISVNVALSIIEEEEDLLIHQPRIFPNPTNDIFYLEIDSPKAETIEVLLYNSVGKRCQQRQINLMKGKNLIDFDLTNLSNGVYIVSFYSFNLKIIKSKR